MNTRTHMIMNIAGFQLGWFACVLMAANQQPAVGAIIALVIVAVHVSVMKHRLHTLALLISVTLLGTAWDSVLVQQQILLFDSGMIAPNLAPYWIITMWLLFATTLNVSLRWLQDRYWLAMVSGAIAGPAAYFGGAALGAVIIPDTETAILILAIGWAALMPLLMMMARLLNPQTELRTAP